MGEDRGFVLDGDGVSQPIRGVDRRSVSDGIWSNLADRWLGLV